MKRKYSQQEVEQHMLGRIYINRDDSNVFVRKKGLYAWTMNLGNKWSWIIMSSITIIIILMYILGNRYVPKSLEKIMPESLWTKTTQCRVIEIDKFIQQMHELANTLK